MAISSHFHFWLYIPAESFSTKTQNGNVMDERRAKKIFLIAIAPTHIVIAAAHKKVRNGKIIVIFLSFLNHIDHYHHHHHHHLSLSLSLILLAFHLMKLVQNERDSLGKNVTTTTSTHSNMPGI